MHGVCTGRKESVCSRSEGYGRYMARLIKLRKAVVLRRQVDVETQCVLTDALHWC